MALGPRGSSIITPSGSTTPGTDKPTITQNPWTTVRRVFFTSEDVKDPARLYQVMQKTQENTASVLHALSQNPTLPANFLRGVTFTAGQTQYLQHRLGRAYQGYRCTRAVGGYPSFQEAAFPSGTDNTTVLPLTSQNAGTFDIEVF